MGPAADDQRCGRGVSLLTLRLIATWTHAPLTTVRSWAKRGHITPVACVVVTRALLYDPQHVRHFMFRDTPTDT